MSLRAPAAAALLGLALLAAAQPSPREAREQAYRENNRGVALLEQFRPQDAAAAFRQALALRPELTLARVNLAIALYNVPDLGAAETAAKAAAAASPEEPRVQYILGLIARSAGRGEEAKAAFQKVLARDPRDVGANLNLGQLLLQERSYDLAIERFRGALGSEPWSATAAYNLGLALGRAGRDEEGQRMMERFQALREVGYATTLGQSYPEQGRYAEAIASTGAEPDLVDEATPSARFVDATREVLASPVSTGDAGRVLLFDYDGDGALDVFDVGAAGQRLYHNERGRFVDVTARVGLDPTQAGIGAVAGDLDNDNRADLLVLRAAGPSLYRNGGRSFVDVTARAGLTGAGPARSAALTDLDHDGDLDVLLGRPEGANRLFQNKGDATFTDVTPGRGLPDVGEVSALVPTDYDNGRDMDLLQLVSGAPRLVRNLRDGRFEDATTAVGLGAPTNVRCIAAADVNKDGYTDFFFGAAGDDLLALSDGRGGFRVAPVPWRSRGTSAAQFFDYDDDGLLDLVVVGADGLRMVRNLGDRWLDVSEPALAELRSLRATSLAAGDWNGDGGTDLLLRLQDGGLRLLRNDAAQSNGGVRVRLAGLVSNRSGVGAKVELRAGSLFQKLETTAATPAATPADIVFGLGRRGTADAVRVIWPSGVVQTELSATSPGNYEIKELNRKPSSCPYLYAWNGRRFAFVTDFMGGGEMGYLEAPGEWNVPDPVEYVRLTDEQLRPRDGRLELRVTNELEEAVFADRFALVVFSHPAEIEIHPHEGMTAPAKPDRVYALTRAREPLRGVDDHGRDVSDLLARVDRRWPDGFGLRPVRGYADEHTLTLDLGPGAERAALLLTGWTDYAWSSDNVAAQQAGLVMRPPSLQVQAADGGWVTAIEQIGIPVGRPQTVVADLQGIWKGPSRSVRIVTNMRIYWDQIRVAEEVDLPLAPTTLLASRAELRERGFSAEVTPDGREPFGYDYDRVLPGSPWKQFPGLYTKTGDVKELLDAADDVYAIARPGDEIALEFGDTSLPALPVGWRRTYLLLADGFSKEMDVNSATPNRLGPLPFHGMSRYPYAAPESYPMTEARARLMELYNTRIVKAPVPALDAAGR